MAGDIPETVQRWTAKPAPRRNLIRYHGSLAPNARLRSRIVPAPGPEDTSHPSCDAADCGSVTSRARGLSWAQLMRRVFEKDVLECPRCSGRMRVVATINRPSAVRAILEHLGLSAPPPALAPARESPQRELDDLDEA